MKKMEQPDCSTDDEADENSPQPSRMELSTSRYSIPTSLDPEREELAYDENGQAYVRKTPLGMLEEAKAEANQRELADYRDPISILRQKGFSFREIAEFLTERGVYADHNAVYRIYTKFMTPEEIQEEVMMEEEARDRLEQSRRA
jgi:hypothetical protein